MLRSKEVSARRHVNPGGAGTSLPLSPERLKPLHAQVTSLREQRVSLQEEVKSLKEECERLKHELASSADRCRRLEQRTSDAEDARERAEEEARVNKQMSTQLLTAAGAWKSQLEEAESNHTRSTLMGRR